MELVSTRDPARIVRFRDAVLDCMPRDGGLYVPAREEDLRPWIMYMDDKTSFASIAGTLTSALLKNELSPVVSERIAAAAFSGFSPELRRLDERLYSLELFHGPTGCHKDFGFLWLASALEHILTIEDRNATVLAATAGMSGRSMAAAFAGKKRLKAILVYPKGTLVGLDPAHLAWNGGNVYPVEIEGTLSDAQSLVRGVYGDRSLVEKHGLTLANTMNIGRILPQTFFYMYAFTRIKRQVLGDIFYAVPSGNYGNLVAGLYAWKFSLPVNGFITDATPSLLCDVAGRCYCKDSGIPLSRRGPSDPAETSNIERLEQVFAVNSLMLSGLVFPAEVDKASAPAKIREVWDRYGIALDPSAATALAAADAFADRVNSDQGTVVLVSKDHPAFQRELIGAICGETPPVPDFMRSAKDPVSGARVIPNDRERLVDVLREFS
jgi:threonine synthase